jgi:hypothetical protein
MSRVGQSDASEATNARPCALSLISKSLVIRPSEPIHSKAQTASGWGLQPARRQEDSVFRVRPLTIRPSEAGIGRACGPFGVEWYLSSPPPRWVGGTNARFSATIWSVANRQPDHRRLSRRGIRPPRAGVAKLADAQDLKSWVAQAACGFDPRPRQPLTAIWDLAESAGCSRFAPTHRT